MKLGYVSFCFLVLVFQFGKNIGLLREEAFPTGKEFPFSRVIHPSQIDSILNLPKLKEYFVFNEDGEIKYSVNEKDIQAEKLTFKIDMLDVKADHYLVIENGFLAGFDWGEFGGGLFLFNNDREKVGVIHNYNSRGLVRKGNGIYNISGVDHFDYHNCKLIKISRNEVGVWSSEALFSFEKEIPNTINLAKKGSLVISTNKHIYTVEMQEKINFIPLDNIKPHLLRASSSIVDLMEDILYLGMETGVYKVNLGNSSLRNWLVE